MYPDNRLLLDDNDDCILVLETEDELNEVLSVMFESTSRPLPEPG